MKADADVAAAAALLSEPTRAALVLAVMEEEALPASDLAARAGIAPSTASEHLRRLVGGGFLTSSKSGRHRYYRLADPAVAEAIEALALVAPQPPVRSLRDANQGDSSATPVRATTISRGSSASQSLAVWSANAS